MKTAGNSGLFIWADGLPFTGSPFSRGIEIQILDPGVDQPGKNERYTAHGDIFAVNGAALTVAGRISPNGRRSFPTEERTKPTPEWNHYRVAGINGDISLSVNGREVTIAKAASPRKGYLMLESEGSEAHFRNLRIKELPSANPRPDEIATEGEGYASLFTGLDFRGWKVPPRDNDHWRIIREVIDYDAQSESTAADKSLWSDREFDDFQLIADWRIKETPCINPRVSNILPDGSDEPGPDGEPRLFSQPDSSSGICLRGMSKYQVSISCWPAGSGEIHGVRRDASLAREVRRNAVPAFKADNPVGQWNRFDITVRGTTVNVLLNGRVVIPRITLPGLRKRGPIGLLHSGARDASGWTSPPSLVQFRNIFIRELKR